MRNQWHNLIRFTLAFTIALQSLMPTVAIAEITMRCVNAHTIAAPCSREVVPAEARTSANTYSELSASCPMHSRSCHHMANCPMMNSAVATTTANMSSIAAPACAITSTVRSAGPDNLAVAAKQWMLTTSPAQAPPSLANDVVANSATVACERLLAPPPRLPKDPDPSSHGLRAPPTV